MKPYYVLGENGNVALVKTFGSIENARAALESLVNCFNCVNCSDCSGCSDLSNAQGQKE